MDVCGKNAELTLQSRVKGFTKRMLADLLYHDRLLVDYSALILSMGDVAQVQLQAMEWTADNVLSVRFDRGRGSGYDHVYLYVYVPELGTGFLSAPAYRRDKRIALALPDEYAGHDAQVYLMVQSPDGRWSDSLYAGEIALNEIVAMEEEDLESAPSAAGLRTGRESTHPSPIGAGVQETVGG